MNMKGYPHKKGLHKKGQTIIFFLMVLVILFFAVLWNLDLHKIIHIKFLSQNAGDSASLMAARWQGITLNLIGDLNVMQAVALMSDDTETLDSVTNLSARLLYVGPMIAFMASQQAAKNNNIYVNEGFNEILEDHINEVRDDYLDIFTEPYTDCWEEYADMLQVVLDDGVAAGPDNIKRYSDYNGSHYLLMTGFYDAISSEDWCWFLDNAYDLLNNYDDWTWWGEEDPLPPPSHISPINSEIFGVELQRQSSSFSRSSSLAAVGTSRLNATAVWYGYNDAWSAWDAMSLDAEWPFPAAGRIKDQYNTAGADAVVRIEAGFERLTPGENGSVSSNTILWTSAAKPFGSGSDDQPLRSHRLVLPAFHQVHLIPLDGSSSEEGGGYDSEWRKHIDDHLPIYVSRGPNGLSSCWYCSQLKTWERPAFRASGIYWLQMNSQDCEQESTGGGGGSSGGGTRRGH